MRVISPHAYPQAVESSILEGSDEIHVLKAVSRWLGILVWGDRHSNLGTADRAAIHDLDLAQLTRGGWFGNRLPHGTEHRHPHTHDHVERADRHQDIEHAVTEQFHGVSLRAPPVGDTRGSTAAAKCSALGARLGGVQTIDDEAQILCGGSVANGDRATVLVD